MGLCCLFIEEQICSIIDKSNQKDQIESTDVTGKSDKPYNSKLFIIVKIVHRDYNMHFF